MVNQDNKNYDKLLEFSRDQSDLQLKNPLHKTFTKVKAALSSLRPLSCTALGPGLLCSLGLLQVMLI